MTSVRFIAPAALAAALLLTSAASAEPCTANADCPLSYRCEVTQVFCAGGMGAVAGTGGAEGGAEAAGMAGATPAGAGGTTAGGTTAGGTMAGGTNGGTTADPVPSGGTPAGGTTGGAVPPCEVYEYRECVPGPCSSDLECSEGFFCDTWEEGYYTDPGDEFVVTGEGSQCSPKWLEPCSVAEDCGPGFDCVPVEQCTCSGSGGAPGVGGSGMGGAVVGGAAGAGTAGVGNVAAVGAVAGNAAPIIPVDSCLGVVCPAGQTCLGGACVDAGSGCPPGFTQCASACVDISSNPSNCGACGVACAAGQVCEAGICLTSGAGGSGGADCECQPTGTNSCQAREIDCTADSDCPAAWNCLDVGLGAGGCSGSSDGTWSCEPAVPDYRCVPPDYMPSWGTGAVGGAGGGSTGGPVGGATSAGAAGTGAVGEAGAGAGVSSGARAASGGTTSGGPPPRAGTGGTTDGGPASGASVGNSADDDRVDSSGCRMSNGTSPSFGALLFGLAAMIGLRRRRR